MSGRDEIDRLLDGAPGDFSVCVQYPCGATAYAYAADVVRPAASLIKVPLAMVLVASDRRRRAGAHGVNLDATVTLRESDRVQGDGAWEGSFDVAPTGTVRTGWQLIDHALRESDNTASNLLIEAIGMQEVNRFMRAAPFCLASTHLQRRLVDFAAAAAGRENWTTAREMCTLFRALCEPDSPFAPLVEPLRLSQYRDALVAGLPRGVAAAHKFGSLPGVEHDVGIVYAPNGPYVVALLSQNLPDSAHGQATLAAASRLVYRHMAVDHACS